MGSFLEANWHTESRIQLIFKVLNIKGRSSQNVELLRTDGRVVTVQITISLKAEQDRSD